ncbi:MAG: hypothetical protein AAF329_06510, partial [Cyanobacteria bacterium P01_A01_bin.17]
METKYHKDMNSLTRKSIMRYAALPELKPRFKELFASGFQYVPYFIALVYRTVRLLPQNHPYLAPENMGRFGVRHVIAEAANNIVVSRKNIDQIVLFVTVMVGLILVTLQLGLLAMSLMFQPVIAAMPTSFAGFFITANPDQDLAHIMLDMVFGIPGIFDSCLTTAVVCLDELNAPINSATNTADWAFEPSGTGTTPVHAGLHELFRIYNTGLSVVAVMISIYFIITVLAETAQSGTPFGKRFNKVWAPVRFVVAFGLLIPITFGLNTSQYIVLYAAKFGSGFATNGWNIFNDSLATASASGLRDLVTNGDTSGASNVAQPNVPEIGTLLQFIWTAKTCQQAYLISGDSNFVQMYAVNEPFSGAGEQLFIANATTYEELWNFYGGESQAIIRFGQLDSEEYGAMLGDIKPTCGEVVLKFS